MRFKLKDELLRHSIVLLVSMMILHVCNMAYQMVVSRLLPPGEYALLTSFLGILLIVARPVNVLSTGMNHYVRILDKQGRRGDIRRLLRKWLLLSTASSVLIALLMVAFSGQINEMFHLERKAPVVVLALSVPVLFLMPIVSGTIQGLQFFGWQAIASILRGILRVSICTSACLWIYAASGWALVGHTGSMYIVTAMLFGVLFLHLRRTASTNEDLPSMRLYLAQSLVVQAGYAVLMTADVVLVNHYFPDETGFPYAATLGRMVASVAVAVGMAMFPKVVAPRGGEQYSKVFHRSVFYSLLCTIPAMLVCIIFPRFLLSFIFGVKTPDASMILYLRMMALVMGFSSVLNIVVQYAVAQHRFSAMVPVVVSAGVYLGVVMSNHSSIVGIIVTTLCCNLLALGASLILLARQRI